MIAFIQKEIASFFSSLMGYLVIAVFLVVNGLLLFFIDSNYNILIAGYNDLSLYFDLAPWVLALLIPALTMKSISEEKRTGTFEILITKPITMGTLVTSKFLGSFLLVLIALLPTLVYVIVLNTHAMPTQLMDFGSTLGGFLGLLLLALSYCSIGIFSSSLSNNQLVSLLIGICLCLFAYFGCTYLAQITSIEWLALLGMQSHYKSISRGVIDSRDIIYFLSIVIVFLSFTYQVLTQSTKK